MKINKTIKTEYVLNRKLKMVLKQLKMLLERCENEILTLEKELSKSPDGKLLIKPAGDHLGCYVKSDSREKSIRISDNKAKQLARKAYAEVEQSDMDMCIEQLKTAVVQIQKHLDKQSVRRGHVTLERIPDYFEFNIFVPNIRERRWLSTHKFANSLYKDELKYETLCGIRVRSKSERLIADVLFEYGILFYYELCIEVNGKTLVPDFIILRPDGKIIIWEHLGLLDDDEYSRKAAIKIEEYALCGFNQHTNLICTNEKDILSRTTLCRIVEERLI